VPSTHVGIGPTHVGIGRWPEDPAADSHNGPRIYVVKEAIEILGEALGVRAGEKSRDGNEGASYTPELTVVRLAAT
jgi:hypothetical protein